MKIKLDKIIKIYLNNDYLKTKKLNISHINEFISKIIKTLKYYNIKLNGYYSINIFIDKNYGIIMEIIQKIKYDYLKQIDTNIKIKKTTFLLKITDFININEEVYKYRNNYYIKINKNLIKNLEYYDEICYNTKSIIKFINLVRG